MSIPANQLPSLVTLGEHLRTQDNAITADPIFLVQSRFRQYGMDPQYADDSGVVWLDEDCNEVDEEERVKLEERYEETYDDHIDHFTRTAYADRWEFVQPFFTRAGAQAYIDANKHRHEELRIYVDSAYRNPEWQAIRAYLMSLPLTESS